MLKCLTCVEHELFTCGQRCWTSSDYLGCLETVTLRELFKLETLLDVIPLALCCWFLSSSTVSCKKDMPGGKKVFKTTVTTLKVILFPFSGSVLGVFMT